MLWLLRSGTRWKDLHRGSRRVRPCTNGSSSGSEAACSADAIGLPLAIDIASASEAEVNRIEPLLDSAAMTYVQGKLIYDKAAEYDALRDRLSERDIVRHEFYSSI